MKTTNIMSVSGSSKKLGKEVDFQMEQSFAKVRKAKRKFCVMMTNNGEDSLDVSILGKDVPDSMVIPSLLEVIKVLMKRNKEREE